MFGGGFRIQLWLPGSCKAHSFRGRGLFVLELCLKLRKVGHVFRMFFFFKDVLDIEVQQNKHNTGQGEESRLEKDHFCEFYVALSFGPCSFWI